jgi:hypothetical protein
MTNADGMVAVWLNVRPEHEEEFNDWYELEHVRDVIAIDGFVSGRRYYDASARLRYLALYETVDDTVEPGPGFQGLVAHPTPWTTRIRRLFGDMRTRTNFRKIADTGLDQEPGAIVTVHARGAAAPADAQARRAAVPGCLRYRGFHESGLPANRFEIYDFDGMDAARAAGETLRAGGEVSVRVAVGTPHQRQPLR